MKIVSFNYSDTHYPTNLIDVKNRNVLDLGCGLFGYVEKDPNISTSEWWYNHGAKQVIGLDIETRDIEVLKQRIPQGLFFTEAVSSPEQIKNLITKYNIDVIKCDIEGYENNLLNLSDEDFSQIKEYYIETHDFGIQNPADLILYNGFINKLNRCGYIIKEVYEYRHGLHGRSDKKYDEWGIRLIFAYKKKLKLLISLATYGDKNFKYLNSVIDEYKSYKNYDITINVHGTIPLPRISLPENDINFINHVNPANTVFFHREEFVNEKDNYDLFLFSEDDILIKEEAIDTYIKYDKLLPINYCLGFVRYEKYTDDEDFHFIDLWPSVHTYITSKSICIEGNWYFSFLNVHQSCWILNKDKLKYSINNSEFATNNNLELKTGLESAASGIYSGWSHGSKGVINKVYTKNIDDLKKCLIHHMPNRHLNGEYPHKKPYINGFSTIDSLIKDIL